MPLENKNTLERLPAYAVFAGVLASAGLPIYIHAPKFFIDEYGVSLTSIAGILFFLRLFDVIQDPAFGWLSGALRRQRRIAVAIAAGMMVLGMSGLFAVTPLTTPLVWFGIMLALLFSGFSFLTITFYAQGVGKAVRSSQIGHVRLASWRETGALAGICIAAIAPTVFIWISPSPFTVFTGFFVAGVTLAVVMMAPEWSIEKSENPFAFCSILKDPVVRKLLLIAFVNAAPVAVTSTLFLFFVETVLDAPGFEGPLLLLFFVSAAASAPFWANVAKRISSKKALLMGMSVSVATFAYASLLGAGDVLSFMVVCIASGLGLGADLTLLPAIFADRVAKHSHSASPAFGLWSFVSKLTLAVAAITVLPLLESSGLEPGIPAPVEAVGMLTLLYAVVPCILKLIAIGLLLLTPLSADQCES